MKKLFALALLLSLSCFSQAASKTVPLFNGKNLKHWQLPKNNAWEIKDGELTPTAKTGYIWTKKDYSDFELSLDFKMSEKCNSGVFFRTDPDNPVQGGFEVQIFDSANKDEIGKHDCGALYDAVVPSENAAKPAGEWNHMDIRLKGSSVRIHLNGKKVVDVDLKDWKTARENPDGSKNKFKTALSELPQTGRIGFQYHGHPVWFKNVKIAELD